MYVHRGLTKASRRVDRPCIDICGQRRDGDEATTARIYCIPTNILLEISDMDDIQFHSFEVQDSVQHLRPI